MANLSPGHPRVLWLTPPTLEKTEALWTQSGQLSPALLKDTKHHPPELAKWTVSSTHRPAGQSWPNSRWELPWQPWAPTQPIPGTGSATF